MLESYTDARFDTIEVERAGPAATIWLNRPDAHNTVNLRLSEELKSAAFDLEGDHDVRVVLLRGRGRQFSAGGDMSMFRDNQDRIGRYMKDVIGNFYEALLAFRRMPKPVVAVVHGAAAGGGLSLALACDVVVAATGTKFATAYRRLGVSVDGGMSHLLSRLCGTRKAVELLLLDEGFGTDEALALGLVNRVSDPDALEADVARIAGTLAANAPAATAAMKRLAYAAPTATFEEQLGRELAAFSECAATEDFQEGVDAFLARRKPAFRGC